MLTAIRYVLSLGCCRRNDNQNDNQEDVSVQIRPSTVEMQVFRSPIQAPVGLVEQDKEVVVLATTPSSSTVVRHSQIASTLGARACSAAEDPVRQALSGRHKSSFWDGSGLKPLFWSTMQEGNKDVNY